MKISNLKIIFSAFAFFFILFFKWNDIDPTLFGWARNGLIFLFIILNRKCLRMLYIPEYKWINVWALLWCILIIFSAYMNQDLSYDVSYWDFSSNTIEIESMSGRKMKNIIYFASSIIIFILYFEYLNKYKAGQIFIKYFFIFLFPFVIISDLSALTYNTDGIIYETGTKFDVCYLNIILLTVYIMKKGIYSINVKTDKLIKFLFVVLFVISIKTKCTTMIIGTLLFYYLLYRANKNINSLMYKPSFYLIGLFVFDILFIFIINWVLTIPIVQYIVVDVFNEDLTLTGRTGIYAKLAVVISESPLYGFGWDNSHVTSLMYNVGTNAQNGLLNMYIEIGILGCVFYLTMLSLLIKKSIHNRTISYPVICFVYMMLFLSSVEITYSNYFTPVIILLVLKYFNTASQNVQRYTWMHKSFTIA